MDGVPCERVDGVDCVDFCHWVFDSVGAEGVILGLILGGEKVVCYAAFYGRGHEA